MNLKKKINFKKTFFQYKFFKNLEHKKLILNNRLEELKKKEKIVSYRRYDVIALPLLLNNKYIIYFEFLKKFNGFLKFNSRKLVTSDSFYNFKSLNKFVEYNNNIIIDNYISSSNLKFKLDLNNLNFKLFKSNFIGYINSFYANTEIDLRKNLEVKVHNLFFFNKLIDKNSLYF